MPKTTTNRPAPDAQPRLDLVARIRAEIAAGTYMTQEKLEETVDRLHQMLRDSAGRSTAQG